MNKLLRIIRPCGSAWLADFGMADVTGTANSLITLDGHIITPRTLYRIILDKSIKNQRSIQVQKLLYGFFQKKFRFFSENLNHEAAKAFTMRLYNEEKKKIPKEVVPPANKEFQTSALMSIIYVSLSHTCLLLLYTEEYFIDQLKSILIASDDRAVSDPGFIGPKKYTGSRPHGFLFLLAAKAREGTYSAVKRQRKEGFGDGILSVSHSNRWVSQGGVRKGKGESCMGKVKR